MWWRLFWWIIVTALTDLLQKRPPDATPAGIGDFDIPTATEGRIVPVALGGKMKVNAPNCIWYGDYAAIERTQETGVIIKKENTIGYTYELSLAYALFTGECVGITGVWIGDERVYDGPPLTVIDINKDDIFGGKDQGGGFIGRLRLFNGKDDQPVSAFMASRITEGLPAYRGTTYVMVTDTTETKGAEIGESPNLRYLKFEVQLHNTVAQGGLADFLQLGNDHHFIGDDANPGSLAYGLLTNEVWGRALPVSSVDKPSFIAAAETCYTEGIGFSIMLDKLTTTSDIQDLLEQHMDGYIGPNAKTGKFEIKLARPDYVLANQFQANDSNIVDVPNWNKGDWTQTFNRVRMRYADRAKDWNETHAVANAPANRIIQGRLQSQEVRYPGVHDGVVANKIVAREKKNLSRPARSGTIELNRTAWDLRPGDVFSFTSSLAEETDLPVRITKTEVGSPVKNTLVVDVVEDIFDNETPTVADPPDTDFVTPTQQVFPILAADQWAIEAPYIITRQDVDGLPNVHPRLLTAARISTGAPTEYEVVRRTPGGSGTYTSTAFVTGGFMQAGTLRNAEVGWISGNGGKTIQVDPIAGSLDNLIGGKAPGSLNMTGVCVINPGAANEEWILTDNIVDDLGGIRLENVWRGAMDTGQKVHSAGERIWFIWTGGIGLPTEQFSPGADIDVKLLPRSPNDAVLEANATNMNVDMLATNTRYQRPLLPASVFFNGVDFSTEVNFDTVLTNGANPLTVGTRIGPRLRDWRNQDVLDQVQGGGIRADIWGDDQHEIQYWLYNLTTHPSPVRGNAIFNITVGTEFATDGIADILKSVVDAEFQAAEANTLPMRLEVETSHIPGAGLLRMTSKEVVFHDFDAIGTFIIPPEAVYVHLSFESPNVEGDRFAIDTSPNNHIVRAVNGDLRVTATAPSPGLGSFSLNVGKDNALVLPANSGSYMYVPNTGEVTGALDWNQDFTLEFRMVYDAAIASASGHVMAHGGGSSGGDTMKVDLNPSALITLEMNNVIYSFSHTPLVQGTWYGVMFTRKINQDTTVSYRLHIDGVLQDTVTVAAHTIGLNTTGVFSFGSDDANRTLTSGVAGDGFTGSLDEIRVILGYARELIDYPLDTVAFTPASAGIVIAQTRLEWEHGQNAKLANDLASTDTAWVYDGTCSISGAQSKFGRTSLFVDGVLTISSGLRWGNFETYEQQRHQYLREQDFTIEGWINFNTLPSGGNGAGMVLAGAGDNSPAVRSWYFGFDETNELEFAYSHTGSAWENVATATTTPALSTGTWYWMTACRSGDALECWLDGTRYINEPTFFQANPVIYNSLAGTSSTSPICLGKAGYQAVSAAEYRSLHGHIDDFRVTKRLARYTGASITVPTEYLPTPSRQSTRPFLGIPKQSDVLSHYHFNTEDANYDPYFNATISILEFEGADTATSTTDLKDGTRTWTFSGSAQLDTAQFSIGTSSLLLNGTTDYIDCGDDTAFDWPDDTVDWTIEMDVRFNTLVGTNIQTLLSKANVGAVPGWVWQYNENTAQLQFSVSTNGANGSTASFSWSPSTATWYNVVLQKSASRFYLWIDGVFQSEQATFSIGTSAETHSVVIGARNIGGTAINFFDGWIDHFRFTQDQRHNETQQFNRLGNIDPVDFAFALREGHPDDKTWANLGTTALAPLNVNGNPFFDRAQKKFGTASLYLDGVDDWAQISGGGTNFDAYAFTLEAQVRFEVAPGAGNMTIASQWNTQFNARGWILAVRNNVLTFEWDDSFSQFSATGAWTPVADTWYHVKVVKCQGTIRLFVDGVQVGSTYLCSISDRQISNSNTSTNIGCHFVLNVATDLFNGWIDEFRIIRQSETTSANGRFYDPYFYPIGTFTPPVDEYDFNRTVMSLRSLPGLCRLGGLADWSNDGGASHTYTSTFAFFDNEFSRMVGLGGLKWDPSTWYQKKYGSVPHPVLDYYTNGSSWVQGSPLTADNRQLRTKAFTFDTFVNFTTDPNSISQALFGHYDDSGNQRSFLLYYDSALNDVKFTWYDGTTALGTATFAWADPAINTWYHIAFVRDGDALRFYVDGVLQTAGGDTLPANYSFFQSSANWGIGIADSNFAGGNPFWHLRGAMQDPRVTWKALYNAGFTPPANPPLTIGSCIE